MTQDPGRPAPVLRRARPLSLQLLALGSLGVSLVVLGIKYAAYALTGSVALYSDALESIINVATALVAICAIRIAAKPADDGHPYGHHKAEYLSAVVVGVLIVVAALAILREAYHGLVSPKPLHAPLAGLAVSTVATLLNAAWSWMLIREGRRQRSPALEADGRHLMTDVVTSAGVVAGVLIVAVSGWTSLDSVLAALVALHVLWNGWDVMRESVGGLMDVAVPEATLKAIHDGLFESAAGALEIHDLRTRQAGRMTFVDFHLVVDGTMSVAQAHAICDRLERAIREAVQDALITIHVEPDDKAKNQGIVF